MPSRRPWVLPLAVLAFASPATAQERRWYVNGMTGQSVVFLGSKDNRVINGFGASYVFGDRARLRWGSQPGTLVGEAYYHLSQGPAWGTHNENTAQAWGLLAYARYFHAEPGAPKMFADIGWGFQIASTKTRDLSSKLNSTPVFDLGVIIGSDHERTLIGVRFMHISNGGAVRKNKGQNELFIFMHIPL